MMDKLFDFKTLKEKWYKNHKSKKSNIISNPKTLLDSIKEIKVGNICQTINSEEKES